MAPEFLFRIEAAEPIRRSRAYRLDAYTRASRLVPVLGHDTGCHAAAGCTQRRPHTAAGLQQQLERLTSSPRYEQGARAFFADMLQLDGFDNLVKDPAIYPKFNQSVADSAREQTLKTTLDLLVRQQRDYRELFTSNETFINRSLAAVYQVPFVFDKEWAPYTFDDVVRTLRHPDASQLPVAVRASGHFVADPPRHQDPRDLHVRADAQSARGRGLLQGQGQHAGNGARPAPRSHAEHGCTACHRRSDPPGLALEHFDGLGQLRTRKTARRSMSAPTSTAPSS